MDCNVGQQGKPDVTFPPIVNAISPCYGQVGLTSPRNLTSETYRMGDLDHLQPRLTHVAPPRPHHHHGQAGQVVPVSLGCILSPACSISPLAQHETADRARRSRGS